MIHLQEQAWQLRRQGAPPRPLSPTMRIFRWRSLHCGFTRGTPVHHRTPEQLCFMTGKA